jgi:ADP-ribose pyrophosphatase YjhB (NUDIX family)
MNFCSDCGHSVTRRWIAAERRARDVCTSCGTTHYQNPRIIVSCALYWQDQLLMCRRSQEPARGQWTVPAGFLECGETLEEGAARETFEETGVIVEPSNLQLYSIVNLTAIEQVVVSFRAECPIKPLVRVGAECLEAAFVSESQIPAELFAWSTVMGNHPQKFFEEVRSRNFSIQQITIDGRPGSGLNAHECPIGPVIRTR